MLQNRCPFFKSPSWLWDLTDSENKSMHYIKFFKACGKNSELVPRWLFWKKYVSVQKLNLKKTKEFQMVTMQVGSKECCVLPSSSYGVKKIHKDIICKSILCSVYFFFYILPVLAINIICLVKSYLHIFNDIQGNYIAYT